MLEVTESLGKTIVTGWLAKTMTRTTDLDKNPTSPWKEHYSACHGSGINPYVYTTAAKAKQALHGSSQWARDRGEHWFDNLYDDDYAPRIPYKFYTYNSSDWKAHQALDQAWWNGRPLIGYRETVKSVVPGRIVADLVEYVDG